VHVNNIVGSSPLAKSDQSQISLPGPYLFLKREVQPIVLERLQELSENADYRTRLCIALAFAIVFIPVWLPCMPHILFLASRKKSDVRGTVPCPKEAPMPIQLQPPAHKPLPQNS
jgi:hypothetical protein